MAEGAPAQSLDLDTRQEAVAVGGEAKYWQQQLALAEDNHRDFIKDGQEVIKRYKNEERSQTRRNSKRFNILYSNTEVLHSALFARMARPDIRRRFADPDPVGKQIAEIVERSAIYCDDSYDAGKEFDAGIKDYLLPGRAVVRVCYEAETTAKDGKEYVAQQKLYDQHIPWDEFRHEPARKWSRVTWIAFRHLMSRDDLKENFPKLKNVNDVPLNWSPGKESNNNKIPEAFKRAIVWEIWDKTKKTRVWVVDGFKDLLRKDADPYRLENFYPIAEPLQAVTDNETFIPKHEFSTYQDQADGLDEIEARIDKLTRALKRRGVYDATFKELGRLSKANDNEFIPVKNYADLSQKGGLAAAFQPEDLKVIAEVLRELHEQRDLRVQTIYEVIGIADIMRGSTDPRETLGAQKIKAQFGGNRLKKRQDKVQKWIRDTLRLKAEIIAEHFEPQKLSEMTGFPWVPAPPVDPQTGQPVPPNDMITPDMIKVLRSDKLRAYRIDIETDSTVFEDAEAEKAATVEMLKAVSEFVTAWVPILQAQPSLLDLAFEMLAFGLRHFKMGRSLEEAVEQARMKLEEAAQQPAKPDPKVQAEQAKAAAEQQKVQMDMEAAKAKHAMEMEKMQAELAMERERLAMEQQKQQVEQQIAAAEHSRSIELANTQAAAKQQDAELRERDAIFQRDIERQAADEDLDRETRRGQMTEEAEIRKLARQEEYETKQADREDERENRKQKTVPPSELVPLIETLSKLVETMNRPRKLVRGPDGRATGVQ